jgi:hypothetical protein
VSGGRTVKVLMSLVTLALFLASCGGSDEKSLTKAEFIEQGDEICKQGDQEFTADYEEFLKSHEIKGVLNESQSFEIAEEIYLPNVEKRLGELQELSPPEADQAQVEKIFASTEDALAASNKDVEAMFADVNPFEKSKTLAKEYGFKVCGTT